MTLSKAMRELHPEYAGPESCPFCGEDLDDPIGNGDELQADAQALADMRALDNWEDNHPTMGTVRGPIKSDGGFRIELWEDFSTKPSFAAYDCPTREDARAKAAAWAREQKLGTEAKAVSQVFQPWRKFKPDQDGTPHGWIQWKGTDVCLDFHCKCGAHGHVDADFAYYVKCSKCGQVYELSGHVEAHPVDAPDPTTFEPKLAVAVSEPTND